MTRKVGTFGDLRSAIHSGEIFSPTAGLLLDQAAVVYLAEYLARSKSRWVCAPDGHPARLLAVRGGMFLRKINSLKAWGKLRTFFASEGYPLDYTTPQPVRHRLVVEMRDYRGNYPLTRVQVAQIISSAHHNAIFEAAFVTWWKAYGAEQYEADWLSYMTEDYVPGLNQPLAEVIDR